MEELAVVPDSMPNQHNTDAGEADVDQDMSWESDTEVPIIPIIDDISMEANCLWEACQPLYPGAKSTKLASTLLLMNICTVHSILNKFMDQLLALLHEHLLPLDNILPSSMYAAKSLTSKVGLDYKHIHACVNGCICTAKYLSEVWSCLVQDIWCVSCCS